MIWIKYKVNTRAAAGEWRYKYMNDDFKGIIDVAYEGNAAKALVDEDLIDYIGNGQVVEAEVVPLSLVPDYALNKSILMARTQSSYYNKLEKQLKNELACKRLGPIELEETKSEEVCVNCKRPKEGFHGTEMPYRCNAQSWTNWYVFAKPASANDQNIMVDP